MWKKLKLEEGQTIRLDNKYEKGNYFIGSR